MRGERSSNQDRKGFGTLLHQEGMVGRSKKGAAEERGGDLRRFVQAEIDIVEGDFYMQEGTEPVDLDHVFNRKNVEFICYSVSREMMHCICLP